jgi:hypothetical protein
MRKALISVWMLMFLALPVAAQVSIGIGFSDVNIGINLASYPALVPVPGYPVYYAPGLSWNYFFYDGMYWVYQGDRWYASSWYNGPWYLVSEDAVPFFVLRVPVRYYRQPPPYFRGWAPNAAPRWDEHWGPGWAQKRSGWDSWDRKAVPARAPLPVYQRKFGGDRYPRAEQQQTLQSQNYHHPPRDPAVRQQYQMQRGQPVPAPGGAASPRVQSPPMRGAPAEPRGQEREQRPQQRRQPDTEPQSRGRDAGQPGEPGSGVPGRDRQQGSGRERDHERQDR